MKKLLLTANLDVHLYPTIKNKVSRIERFCKNYNVQLEKMNSRDKRMISCDTDNIPDAYLNLTYIPNPILHRFLSYLELKGVVSINPSLNDDIIASNKMLTFLKCKHNGIHVPNTISFGNVGHFNYIETKKLILEKIGLPCVIKHPAMAGGFCILKIDTESQLDDITDLIYATDFQKIAASEFHNEFIVQKCIQSSFGQKVRIIFYKDEVLVAMKFINNSNWKVKFFTSETIESYEVTSEILETCKKIHKIFNINFSGLDFLLGEDGLIFNEININPGVNYIDYEKVDQRIANVENIPIVDVYELVLKDLFKID